MHAFLYAYMMCCRSYASTIVNAWISVSYSLLSWASLPQVYIKTFPLNLQFAFFKKEISLFIYENYKEKVQAVIYLTVPQFQGANECKISRMTDMHLATLILTLLEFNIIDLLFINRPPFSLRCKIDYILQVNTINRMGQPINTAIGFGLQKS